MKVSNLLMYINIQIENFYKKMEKIKELKIFIKPILILSTIYIIGFSAIIRANFLYIDDLGRAYSGYKGWDNFSRYTSQFLSTFIHCDNYLTEISPLTQIIASVFLSMSGLIILYVLTKKTSFSFWEYTSVAILGLSPYFLQCISYKYDSPYMALSILAAVFPMIFYDKKKIYFIITSIIGTIIVCTSYQASSGIFPMFVALMAFIMWLKKENIKDIFKFIGSAFVGYLLGLIIFKVFIMTPVDTYVSSAMTTNLFIVFENYKKYFELIISDFKIEWIYLIGLLVFSFIYVVLRNSKQNKILTFIISLITIAILIMLSFGLYPLFEKSLFDPRTMYGFGVCIAFLASYIAISNKMIVGKIASLGIFWVFFVFAFTYGNALYQQQEYTDFRIGLVINDLIENDLLDAAKTKMVHIDGSIGQAPAIRKIPNDYGILDRLIPDTFGSPTFSWAIRRFQYYYGLKGVLLTVYDINEELTTVESNIYHTIKADDNNILIELYE